jgi:hypothetical protein
MSNKPPNDTDQKVQEIVDKVASSLYEHFHKRGSTSDLEQADQLLKVFLSFKDHFWEHTTDAKNFYTMDQIERLLTAIKKINNDVYFQGVIDDFLKIPGEDDIIAEKKKNLKPKE